MAWKESFSGSEWDTLRRAPFGVFFAIAGSDGKIDDKESAEFIKSLVSIGYTLPNGLAKEVIESIIQSMNADYIGQPLESLEAVRHLHPVDPQFSPVRR